MVPHLGAGVGQGFEDTYALCRLLGHPGVQKADDLDVCVICYITGDSQSDIETGYSQDI